MIKITIEGPQGTGKTLLARQIAETKWGQDKKVVIFDEGAHVEERYPADWLQEGFVFETVEIQCRMPRRRP